MMINPVYFFKYLECGGFCIKYILKQDKKKLDVEYNPRLMPFGLIKRVLEEYYLVKCYRVNRLKYLENGRCLTLVRVRNKFNHYVVIKKIENGMVYFYDPAFLFTRKFKEEKFKKVWINCCCFYLKK